MFFMVSNSLKKRFVLIFQEIFRKHPIFEKVEVFTKFPEEERPKNALMVRSISGGSLKLGMDNFVRNAIQYSTLANLKGVPGNSIEWVRDDIANKDKRVAPGFYVVKMLTADRANNTASFKVTPFLLVDNEILNVEYMEGKKGAFLDNKPVNPDSEIIIAEETGFDLKKGIDYTIDYSTGKILFLRDVSGRITVDYQTIAEDSQVYDIQEYEANNTAIPGVIIAFGDRIKAGDEQVVVVSEKEEFIAMVYGGRWQLSCDLVGISQDDDQQERLVDYAISIFWAEWQDRLINEGIIVHEFSLSGEAEDLEAEIPEEYFYTGGISFTVEVDWELHIPMISEVRRVDFMGYGEEGFKKTLSDETEAKYENGQYDQRMASSKHQLGLQLIYPSEPVVVRPCPPVIMRTLRFPR